MPCEPLGAGDLDAIEERSQSSARRTTRWGDVALVAGAQGGPFGAVGDLQYWKDPRSRAAVEIAARKHLGQLRVGGSVGARLSDTFEAVAYSANASLGGTAEVGFFAPLLGARGALVVPLGATALVVGARIVTPSREKDLGLRYCGGGCGEPLVEHWTIGGVTYGADLGLRFAIR